jgi:hypothetical protein
MTQKDHLEIAKNEKDTAFTLSLDRLSIVFTEPNTESVKKTVGLLVSDHITKSYPGMQVTKNHRYEVSCKIPLPFKPNSIRHNVCFEAGPRRPGQASFRLDFNPAALSPEATLDLGVFLQGIMAEDDLIFFRAGKITRSDVALDLPGYHLADCIVRSARMQKHGVYSNRHGDPESTYLGTPRSRCIVVYDKPNEDKLDTHLRLECRVKPGILGRELAELPNPFSGVKLIPANFADAAGLDIPSQFIADSIRMGGLKRALKPLDKSAQKALRAAFTSAQSQLPSVDDLWATWPEVLKSCGLGKQLGAVPVKTYMAAA